MHQWTKWHKNPFAAVAEAANSNGTPEDIEKTKISLAEVIGWTEVSPHNLMDELLQEIAGETNIVVQYGNSGEGYRAAYDDRKALFDV